MSHKSLRLEWKSFNVSLSKLDESLRAECPSYLGMHTDSALNLVFAQEAEESDLETAQAAWDLIDEEHEMTTAYLSKEDLKTKAAERADKIKAKKLGMVSKTWANMSAAERKLAIGLESEVTDEELE